MTDNGTPRKRRLVSTGVVGLDYVLHGGLPEQTVVLVQGAAGAGKTTLGLQFLRAGLANGERCTILSVAQNASELQMVADSHDIDLSGITVCELSMGADGDQGQYTVDTREADLEALLEATYRAVEDCDPGRLVFDSLLELRLLAPDEAQYRQEVLRLKQFLVRRKVSALILDHVAPGAYDRQVEGIAHGVIQLDSYTPRIGTTYRRFRVSKYRGHSFVQGYHDFEIRDGGITAFPRVIPADLGPRDLGPTLSSGYPKLDAMLGGGIEHGSTTLIAGQSGTGKSTLSTVFAVAAARAGTKAGMFLFEELPEVYRDRSRGVGVPLEDHEAAERLILHHFDPAEISPGEFSHTVLSEVEEHGLGLVVIDSLSGYIAALPDADNVVTQIQSLLQYLARSGLVAIVTMSQHGLLGEPPRSDIDVSFLADSVLLLRHTPAGNEIRRTMAVLKKRHSTHERRIKNFVIAPGGVDVEEIDEGDHDRLAASERRPDKTS